MHPGDPVTPALLTELLERTLAEDPSLCAVLHAVLQLHTPDQEGGDPPPPWAPWQPPHPLALVCYAEGHDGEPWPCPTIRVIAEVMGIPTTGGDHVHKSP
jgi:hypothetical protein